MTAGVASERNRVAIWDAEVIRSQLQRMIAIAASKEPAPQGTEGWPASSKPPPVTMWRTCYSPEKWRGRQEPDSFPASPDRSRGQQALNVPAVHDDALPFVGLLVVLEDQAADRFRTWPDALLPAAEMFDRSRVRTGVDWQITRLTSIGGIEIQVGSGNDARGVARQIEIHVGEEPAHDEVEVGQVADSKTGKSARPLGLAAVVILKSVSRESESEFVFPADRGDGHFQGYKSPWKKAVSKAKLVGVSPHTLRHTMGSTTVSSGEALAFAGAILGHANPRSTAIYAHVQHEPARQVANRVSEKIAAALAGLELDEEPKPAEDSDEVLLGSLSETLAAGGNDADQLRRVLRAFIQ